MSVIKVPENELSEDNFSDFSGINFAEYVTKSIETISKTWFKNLTLPMNNEYFNVGFKLDTDAEVNILPLYILNDADKF